MVDPTIDSSLSVHRLSDPENVLYNSLDLNKGVKETFFSIDTPFAFLERFTKPNGTKELGEVLSKWNKGMLVCLSSSFQLCFSVLNDDVQPSIFHQNKIKLSTKVVHSCLMVKRPSLRTTMHPLELIAKLTM